MTSDGAGLWKSRTVVDVLALLAGFVLVIAWILTANEELLILGSYAVLTGTSTAVVTFGLIQFTGEHVGSATEPTGRKIRDYFDGSALETESDVEEDTGWLIGRLENIIVLTFVFAGAFTALSIVFAAKSFVRHEDISSDDTAYYLAGTLLNATYSIVIGIAVIWILRGSFAV